jgi:hypothetical protein
MVSFPRWACEVFLRSQLLIQSSFTEPATGGAGRNFIRSAVVDRWRIMVLTAVGLIGGAATSEAGPCTTQISQVEQQIHKAQAASPGGAGEPTAPQSVGAQLHHQPTPQTVESAESKAHAGAEAALDRARKADAEGDASACAKALKEARELYGID